MLVDSAPEIKPVDTSWSSVTPVASQPLWSKTVRDRLNELTELPNDWDSYGSPPVKFTNVSIALELLANLSIYNMPKPHVVPISGGGVQFEWADDDKELEIEVRANGSIEFLIVDSEENTTEGAIENSKSGKLFCLSNWYLSAAKSVDDLLLVSHARPY